MPTLTRDLRPHPKAEHERLNLGLSITRDASGRETLWADIPELTIHQAVGMSDPPFVCGVIPTPGDINLAQSDTAKATAIDCGSAEHNPAIRTFENTLVLGHSQVEIPAGSFIAHDTVQQPLPPKTDCGPAPGPSLHATLKRERTGVYLHIPLLGVHRRLFRLDSSRQFCETTLYKRAQRLRLECVIGESSTTVELRNQRDILFIERGDTEEASDAVNRSRLGVQLPCNTQLILHGFDYRAPGYYPHALSRCSGECGIVQHTCNRGCIERFSDENAKLPKGADNCTEACQLAEEKCNDRCVARHAP